MNVASPTQAHTVCLPAFLHRWLLLATISLLCALEFLQTGMLAFASLPISGEIEAGPQEYSLIAALYACVAVLAISKQWWLVERLGWRRYVLSSLGLFALGALMCGHSSSIAGFTSGRVVMALGGGGLMTAARVLVNLLAPGPGRFNGIKAFATGLALGMAGAPLLASLAVAHDHWQLIFWVLLGAALLAAILALLALPARPVLPALRSRSSPARIALLATGVFFLLYLLQRAYYDFYDDTAILLAFVVLGLLGLYAYFYLEHRDPQPLLRVRELMQPRYLTGLALFVFTYLVIGANNYVVPLFLQRGLGYAWESVGRMQALGLLAVLLTLIGVLQVVRRSPAPRKFFFCGFAAMALYGVLMASTSPEASVWSHVQPALAANGIFIMLVMSTTAMQTFRDVAHEDALLAHANQVKNMLAQIAMAIGTCGATVFMQWRQAEHDEVLRTFVSAHHAAAQQALAQLTRMLSNTDPGHAPQLALAELAREVGQQAVLLAGIDYFQSVVVVAVVGAIVLMAQRVMR